MSDLKVQRLEKSVVVLVEWIPGEFDAWAKLRGAYNDVTRQVDRLRSPTGGDQGA